MKRLWVNVIPYEKDLAIAALESGAEAVVLPDGESGTVRQFGKINTVEKDGDRFGEVEVQGHFLATPRRLGGHGEGEQRLDDDAQDGKEEVLPV